MRALVARLRHFRRYTPRGIAVLLAGLFGSALIWPRAAHAACGLTDPFACADGIQYAAWEGIAKAIWSWDRAGLQLVYAIDQLRWWIVEVAFGVVYQVLAGALGPLLPAAASIAILLGLLLFVVSPVVGRVNLVNLRHTIVWAVLAPALLVAMGPQLVAIEQLRTTFGGLIIQQGVAVIGSVPVFGARAGDMAEPQALYGGSNPCGVAFNRRDVGIQPDDLAAALVDANVQDIHCPNAVGPSSDLPDAFYDTTSPAYFASSASVAYDLEAVDRQAAIARIQAGVARLQLLVAPVLLAIANAIIQWVFSLCLVTLWLTLPISLVVVYLQQTSSAVTGLFRQTFSVFQVPWVSTAILGILLVCLRATAALANAGAFAGLAFGGLLFEGYVLGFVAFPLLSGCIRTLNDTVMLATGLSLSAPAQLTSDVATAAGAVALGAATGGVGMALTAGMAARETGSGRYATAAALGRIEPVMQAGQVAASMGWVSEETASALHSGWRASNNLRIARGQMQRDAKQPNSDGLTMRTRGQEQAFAQRFAHDPLPTGKTFAARDGTLTTSFERPPASAVTVPLSEAQIPRLLVLGHTLRVNADETVTVWKTAASQPNARVASAPVVASAQARLDLIQHGAFTGDILEARQSLRRATAAAEQRLAARETAAQAEQEQQAEARTTASLRQQFYRGRSDQAAQVTPHGDLIWFTAPTEVPPDAMQVAMAQIDPGKALANGYAVQRSPSGRFVTLWDPNRPVDAPVLGPAEFEAAIERAVAAGILRATIERAGSTTPRTPVDEAGADARTNAPPTSVDDADSDARTTATPLTTEATDDQEDAR